MGPFYPGISVQRERGQRPREKPPLSGQGAAAHPRGQEAQSPGPEHSCPRQSHRGDEVIVLPESLSLFLRGA